MMNFSTSGYIFEPRWTKQLGQFHYHLFLKESQKDDVKGIDRFYSVGQILDAGLNEELTNLLRYALEVDRAHYIKVEILSEEADRNANT